LCDNLAIRHTKEGVLILDIGPINYWLEWFDQFIESKSKEWMFTDRVPRVITAYMAQDKRREFISEFNNPNSKYRNILSQVVLTKMPGLKLEDLTEESLSYLFKELKTKTIGFFDRSIISDIATEQFVTDQMLPLLKKRKELNIRIWKY
jgi:hypothetical protein